MGAGGQQPSRFTSTDPMPQGSVAVSAYTYAENNPLAHTDPRRSGGPRRWRDATNRYRYHRDELTLAA